MNTTDEPREQTPVPHLRPLAAAGRAGVRVARLVSPALVRFLAAKRPQATMAFGRREIHLRRDGLVLIDRRADGGEAAPEDGAADACAVPGEGPETAAPFIPRRPGEQDRDPYMFRTPPEGLPDVDPDEPVVLNAAELEAEVRRRMGERPEATEDDLALAEDQRSAEFIAAEIGRVRDLLQALDDVEDHELIKDLTEDLYQLYKAVDYKIKRHHASEAKVELGKLFKV